MNTLQRIKERATKSRALELARLQMAKAFRNADYTDATHTPTGQRRKPQLRYRGIAYTLSSNDQVATKGRELRYRGILYGVY